MMILTGQRRSAHSEPEMRDVDAVEIITTEVCRRSWP
jgi:hypothetical protein